MITSRTGNRPLRHTQALQAVEHAAGHQCCIRAWSLPIASAIPELDPACCKTARRHRRPGFRTLHVQSAFTYRPDTPKRTSQPWTGRTTRRSNATLADGPTTPEIPPPNIIIPPRASSTHKSSIRDRLRELKLEREILDAATPVNSAEDASNPEAQSLAEEDDIEEEDVAAYMDEFDQMLEDYDTGHPSKFALRPGDLVELSGATSTSSRLAVYLRTVNQKAQYFTISGLLSIATYQNALMIVPGFTSPESLQEIARFAPYDYDASVAELIHDYRTNVPRQVGAPITTLLEQFHAASEEAYRVHSLNLDNAHNILAHPTEHTYIKLEEAASRLTGLPEAELTAPLLLSVSNCLMRTDFGFRIANRTYAYSKILGVESKQTADAVRRVVGWVRAYQEQSVLSIGSNHNPTETAQNALPLREFVEKAKKLIERSRTLRVSSPEGAVLRNRPATEIGEMPNDINVDFSASDQDFIMFLMHLVSTRSYFFHPVLRSMPCAILRATEAYPEVDLDADMVHTFLVEIGVLQPWQDANPFDREVLIRNRDIDAELQKVEENIQQGQPPRIAAGLIDSMQAMRKDWGDLPVFCIDPNQTVDLDDGISLEAVPGQSDQYWLHVHVVHLSAFAPPDNIISRLAANQLTTKYLAAGRVAMLPDWICAQFSLGKDAPVMTISTRLDTHGNKLESKIQAGVVRNVIRLDPEAVNAVFGHQLREHMRLTLATGPEEARPRLSQDRPKFAYISEEHQGILKKLGLLTKKMRQNRGQTQAASTVIYGRIRVNGVDPRIASVAIENLPTQSNFSSVDPEVAYYVNTDYDQQLLDSGQSDAPARVIVEESMVQGGATAAEWAAERRVPIPYFGTTQTTGGLDLEGPALRAQIRDMVVGKRPMQRDIITYFRQQFMSSAIQPDPLPHRPLGLKCYTKITSPLRRYFDLVVQWQVDAAIRKEATLDAGHDATSTTEHGVGESIVVAQPDEVEVDATTQVQESSSKDTDATTTSNLKSNDGKPASQDTDEDQDLDLPASEPAQLSLDAPHLPFTSASILSEAARWRWRTWASRRFDVSHLKHFKTLAMARAFYLNEFPIPPNLTAVLGISGGIRRTARLEQLDIACDTEDSWGADGNPVRDGDRWEVKIKTVKVHSKRIILKMVKRISEVPRGWNKTPRVKSSDESAGRARVDASSRCKETE